MEDPADQPTIMEILNEHGLDSILTGAEYNELLSALQERDNIMRTDAAEYVARKKIIAALNKIIEEV